MIHDKVNRFTFFLHKFYLSILYPGKALLVMVHLTVLLIVRSMRAFMDLPLVIRLGLVIPIFLLRLKRTSVFMVMNAYLEVEKFYVMEWDKLQGTQNLPA